jgi:import inner membrane translocase subunit TIM22
MDAADTARDLGDYDTFTFKTVSATVAGGVTGTILGSIVASWRDVPAVQKNKSLPAIRSTLKVMGSYGLTYAIIGGTYAATESAMESLRHKKDLWNGVTGGCAAGAALGLRSK